MGLLEYTVTLLSVYSTCTYSTLLSKQYGENKNCFNMEAYESHFSPLSDWFPFLMVLRKELNVEQLPNIAKISS